jgi:hypothetical protein
VGAVEIRGRRLERPEADDDRRHARSAAVALQRRSRAGA